MSLLFVLAWSLSLPPALAGRNKPHVLGRGHIELGGPWTAIRSTTVLADQNSIDGFFLAAPAPGAILGTKSKDLSGSGYDLNINFHSSVHLLGSLGPRQWLGSCATAVGDEHGCRVPEGAATVEVTASKGRDLDVTVLVEK